MIQRIYCGGKSVNAYLFDSTVGIRDRDSAIEENCYVFKRSL
ncbi:hypothetical protein [Prochlorothrix hollandica]